MAHFPPASRTLSCLTYLIIMCFSVTTSSRLLPSNSEKVQLRLYYESLCGGCAGFIINPLKDLFRDDELLSIVDLHLFPWGNARFTGKDTFACQHGNDECFLNTVEACAIHAWPKVEDHFPFIYCIESLSYDGKDKEWESCFEKLGLDPKPVTDCYNSELGKELDLQYGRETLALEPKVYYVPWIVLDGKHLTHDWYNITAQVCKAYKGTPVPKACRQFSARYNTETSQVKPQVCHKEAAASTILKRIDAAVEIVI